MKDLPEILFLLALIGLVFLLFILTGCKSVTPTATPTQAVNALPALPPPMALTSDAQARQAAIIANATNRPAVTNLVLAWDTYTNPAADWLAVKAADSLDGPWTNFAIFSPANFTNQILIPIDRARQFFRVAVGSN